MARAAACLTLTAVLFNHFIDGSTPCHAMDVDREHLLDADSHLSREVTFSIPAGVIPPALVVLACQLAIVAKCSCSSVELSGGHAGFGPVEQLKKERDGRVSNARGAKGKRRAYTAYRGQHLGYLIALPLWGQMPLEVLDAYDEGRVLARPWHKVLERQHALKQGCQSLNSTVGRTKSIRDALSCVRLRLGSPVGGGGHGNGKEMV